VGQCASLTNPFPSRLFRTGLLQKRKTDEQRSEDLAGLIMQLSSNALALLLLRMQDLAGARTAQII
jgi:hypothetical protein